MENARATYEGLLMLRQDERSFVLTRAGFAGAQCYAVSWTGDNSSTWNHLAMIVPTLLCLGLSGYSRSARMGADLSAAAAGLVCPYCPLLMNKPLNADEKTH